VSNTSPDAEELRRRRDIGSRIQSLRDYQNVRQDALALKAGIGRTTLQQVEGGKSNARSGTLDAIARALGVPVTWLLTDEWHSPGWRNPGGAGGGEPPLPPAMEHRGNAR